MPANNIDTIQIKVTGDSSGATRTLDALQRRLKNIDDSIVSINQKWSSLDGSGFDKFFKTLQKLEEIGKIQIDPNLSASLAKITNAANKTDPTKYDQIAEGIRKIIEESKGLEGIDVRKISALAVLAQAGRASVAKKVKKGEKALAETEKTEDAKSLDNVTVSSKEAAKAMLDFKNAQEEARKQLEYFWNTVDNCIKKEDQLTAAAEEAAQSVTTTWGKVKNLASAWLQWHSAADTSKLQKSLHAIGGAMSRILSYSKSISKFLGASLAGYAKNAVKPFTALGNAISGIGFKVKRLFSDVMRIAKYRLIRSLIKTITQGLSEGIKNAYNYSVETGNAFAASMDTIATASNYAKNSLGALAMPIINVLSPAVDYITDKFVSLLNFINEMVASLTGQATWTKAIKYPKAWGDEAEDAAGRAKKAADKYKNTILGIDEINPLNGINDNGSGGGGGADAAEDWSSMFETVETDASLAGTALGEFFDTFKQAWDEKGEGVVNSFKNTLSSIKSLITTISSSFSTMWNNGTGQTILSNLLQTITNLNNGVSNLATNFTTAWENAGVGDTIAQNMGDMWKTVSDHISNISKYFENWASKVDFTNLLNSISSLTSAFAHFADVKWSILEDAFNDILLPLASWTIEEAVPTVIEGISTVINDMADILQKAWPTIKPALEGLTSAFTSLAGVVWDTLEDAYNDILKPLATWAISELLPAGIETLTSVLDALKITLQTVWPIVKPVLQFFIDFAADAFLGFIEGLGDLADAISALMQGDFQGFFTGLGDAFVDITGPILEDIRELMEAVGLIEKPEVPGDWSEEVDEALEQGGWIKIDGVWRLPMAFDINAEMSEEELQAFYDALDEKLGGHWTEDGYWIPAEMETTIDYLVGDSAEDPNVIAFMDLKERANAKKTLFYGMDGSVSNPDNKVKGFQELKTNVNAKKTLKYAKDSSVSNPDDKTQSWFATIGGNVKKSLGYKKGDNVSAGFVKDFSNAKTGTSTKTLLAKWQAVADKNKISDYNSAKSGKSNKTLTAKWGSNGTKVKSEEVASAFSGLESGSALKTLMSKYSSKKDKANLDDYMEAQDGSVTKKLALGKEGWKTVTKWIKNDDNWGDRPEKKVGLDKGGWTSVFDWIKGSNNWGENPQKKIQLAKDFQDSTGTNRATVSLWLTKDSSKWGSDVAKPIGLEWESVWSSVSDWIRHLFWGDPLSFPIDITPETSSSGLKIQTKANGGTVASGELYMARENGASEYIGSFGGQAAVANNDQIVAGIAAGVSAAQSEQNRLLREQNDLLRALYRKQTGLSTSDVIKALNASNVRAGHAVVAM